MPAAINRSQLNPGLTVRYLLGIASPVVMVALGSLASRVSILHLGQWAWAGTAPVYWGSLAVMMALLCGRENALSWFGKSRGGFLWPVLAGLVGLSAFPLLLLPNTSLLRTPLLATLWIAYGLINGTLEEAYMNIFVFMNRVRLF